MIDMAAEVNREKSNFINRLDDSRNATSAALADIDPERIIYPASGWRVKDIIAHLAGWEHEVVTSLNAYNVGDEYRIPNFTSDDEYNDQLFQQNRAFPINQINAAWQETRTNFKAAILAISPERFNGEVMCPWGLTSGITGIVNDMIKHEAEHLNDILDQISVQSSSPELD